MPKIILASQSHQRKKLLENAGISFEVFICEVDDTPVKAFSFVEQLNDISLRKALSAMDAIKNNEEYIILAADQNIFFNNTIIKKPESISEAREIIQNMEGSNEIYTYVGNTVLYVSNFNIVKIINKSDKARLRMDYILDEELENYLETKSPLTKCAGINIADTPFLHLEEGKMSTAYGMTIEYLFEMLSLI